jgi:hypothetical protein
MAWVVWRQDRAALATLLAVLVALGALLIVTAPKVRAESAGPLPPFSNLDTLNVALHVLTVCAAPRHALVELPTGQSVLAGAGP